MWLCPRQTVKTILSHLALPLFCWCKQERSRAYQASATQHHKILHSFPPSPNSIVSQSKRHGPQCGSMPPTTAGHPCSCGCRPQAGAQSCHAEQALPPPHLCPLVTRCLYKINSLRGSADPQFLHSCTTSAPPSPVAPHPPLLVPCTPMLGPCALYYYGRLFITRSPPRSFL